MGFLDKFIDVGSSVVQSTRSSLERQMERNNQRAEQVRRDYDRYSYEAKGKSMGELKEEYYGTEDRIKKAAIAKEVKTRRGID